MQPMEAGGTWNGGGSFLSLKVLGTGFRRELQEFPYKAPSDLTFGGSQVGSVCGEFLELACKT